jgi:hypothetical protein
MVCHSRRPLDSITLSRFFAGACYSAGCTGALEGSTEGQAQNLQPLYQFGKCFCPAERYAIICQVLAMELEALAR